MTALRARSRWWWGMAVLVVLGLGCATSPTPRQDFPPVPANDVIIDRATDLLYRANILYEEAVIQSSRAYFSGEMDETTYSGIKEKAGTIEQLLRGTKAGVEVYAIMRSPTNAQGATVMLDALDTAYQSLKGEWCAVSPDSEICRDE